MTIHRSARPVRRTSTALIGSLVLGVASTGTVSALPYDGTNPFNTECYNGSHPTFLLGKQTSPYGPDDEGDPTEITTLGGAVIGTVAIRHSRYCATVWAEVKNVLGVTVEAKEALVTYTDSNGGGRVEHWYPTIDTLAPGQIGWSNQYRDRASFSAIGKIKYNGVWYTKETTRSVAWVQRNANFANTPYACNHSQNFPCKRWPVLANGNSVTREYYISSSIQSLPKTGGGTIDMTPHITFMFDQFNVVAAPNPFFFSGTQSQSEVSVFAYYEVGIAARGGGTDANGDGLYETGVLQFSTWASWSGTGDRGTICHEIDHLMGLAHVWEAGPGGVSNVGSKATCIGMGSNSGPRIDDVSALNDVYTGVVP